MRSLRRAPLAVLVLLAPASLAACFTGGDSTGVECRATPPQVVETRPGGSMTFSFTTDAGTVSGTVASDTLVTDDDLKFIQLVGGTGPLVDVCERVTVQYSIYRTDGVLLASSVDPQGPDAPLSFVIGLSSVIPGFQMGVVGMREGGLRRLIVRPGLAWGSTEQNFGGTTLPPNSTVIVDVMVTDAVAP